MGGLGQMMQAHGEGFCLEVRNQIDIGLVDLAQQSACIVGPAEFIA